MDEVTEFIAFLFTEIRDENILNQYLHRPPHHQITYAEYRAEIIRQNTPVDTRKEAAMAQALEDKYIVITPKEVRDNHA